VSLVIVVRFAGTRRAWSAPLPGRCTRTASLTDPSYSLVGQYRTIANRIARDGVAAASKPLAAARPGISGKVHRTIRAGPVRG
jgi:hypothetical protein